jgi:hypothetical protein
MSCVYQINRGINKSIEFRGLKAQYIGYLAAGLVCLLLLFVVIYLAGVNAYVCLALVFGSAAALIITVSRLSHKYGAHGLMKRGAKKQIPACLKFRSRRMFFSLSEHFTTSSAIGGKHGY